MNSYYAEIAMGSVTNRAIIVSAAMLPQKVLNAQESGNELYRSYFLYDGGINPHVARYKTVSGYTGNYYLPMIVFDIDKGKKSDEATLSTARAFVERLTDEFLPEDSIQIAFSGRGYHVTVPEFFGFAPSNDLPQIVKATLSRVFPEADPIYYDTSLIRVQGTVNVKTNLYKIPLTHEELYNLTPEAIRELAKAPRSLSEPANVIGFVGNKRTDLIVAPSQNHTAQRVTEEAANAVVTCVQKMYKQGGVEGTRHQTALRMVSSWRRAGITQQACGVLLHSWAPALGSEEIGRIVKNVFDKGYQYGCKDIVMSAFCDPKCVFYRAKNYTLDVQSSESMESDFRHFLETTYERGFDLGEVYTMSQPYRFMPGEYVIVTGPTKFGKSAWLQQLCIDMGRLKCLYVNTEIAGWLLYRRFVQQCHRMTKEEVIEHYKASNNHLSTGLSHIDALSIAPSFQGLRKLITERRPNIVVVDTQEGIVLDQSKRILDQQSQIIFGLRDLARTTNTIIFGVLHIRKGGDKDHNGKVTKLSLDSVKGVSAAVQQADKVIAIDGERGMSRRIVHSLASRDETDMSLTLDFDWPHLRFNQLL